MKNKSGAITAKPQFNALKKGNDFKKGQKAATKSAFNKLTAQIVAKNGKNEKKQQIPTKKQLPPKKVEIEEEDDDEEDDDDSENGVEGSSDEGDLLDDAEEEGEEDDDDDEDDDDEEEDDSSEEVEGNGQVENGDEESDDDDEEEGDEDDEEDDDEPTEVPIGKKPKTEEKVSKDPKVRNGIIPKSFPLDQIVLVSRVPQNFSQVEIVEAFLKFGPINMIQNNYNKAGAKIAIAYNTKEGASAALAANGKVKIAGTVIQINKRVTQTLTPKVTEEQSDIPLIIVRNIHSATDDDIKKHFAKCGTIENFKRVTHKNLVSIHLTFTDDAAVQAAKKLHQSDLKGSTITVFIKGEKRLEKDPKRTIVLKNKNDLENITLGQVKAIFAKCGEIEHVELVITKNNLAFVTFKDESSLKKAAKLNGKTIEGVEVDIGEFLDDKSLKKRIVIQNIKKDVTVEQIREFLAECGEIESVYLKGRIAFVTFKTSEAYCKSFLLNEEHLEGQLVFLEPFSERKKEFQKKFGHKRPFPKPQHAASVKKVKRT